MTRLYNHPDTFRSEFLLGLTAAFSSHLRPVPGGAGVVSVSAPQPGRVGVVIGGGSGHYPAFAGLVGPGLCDGAVVGEIFTSPSAAAVYDLIVATDSGEGVLLSFGNYSGDVMHFGLAAQRARREGHDVRIVLVTDDVASASPQRTESRRGVAGGLYVFRAAAGASHAGGDLDEVERVARLANSRVFTLGLAYGGCTFPGAEKPLFDVPPRTLALGLGIHGEPGVENVADVSSAEVAELILSRLLPERPPGATRARLLVNGLGATKYEELFVLTGDVLRGLQEAGVDVVDTEVGEFVTSLDMSGCSVSVMWTLPELDPLLDRATDSPGYRRAGRRAETAVDLRALASLLRPEPVAPPADVEQSEAARLVAQALSAARDAVTGAVHELGRLDAVAGDGDHGLGMTRGFGAAALVARSAGPSAGAVLDAAGGAFAEAGGGASGALWGAGLCAAGHAAGTGGGAIQAARSAVEAVADLGRAELGDKTVLDALVPFVDTLAGSLDAGSSLAAAWSEAVDQAERAAQATQALVSRRGRSAVHGEHSIGTPDPGCVSFVIAVRAAGKVLERAALESPEGSR